MTDKKTLFNAASIGGLVLGGISIVGFYLGTLINGSQGGIVMTILSMLLWVVKFVGCIWLMNYFIKKYYYAEPGSSRSELFRFGNLVAVFSALIFAAFVLAYSAYINPEYFENAILEAANGNPMFNDAMLDQISDMLPQLPTFAFFSQFIYCWLFGLILSAIFSSRIASSNPFDDTDEQ